MKIILWVASGGVEAVSGLPSLDSRLRLECLECERTMLLDSGMYSADDIAVVISGEATRKSGGWNQAEQLTLWLEKRNPDWMVARTYTTSLVEAFRRIRAEFAVVHSVCFINDDAHMSRYLLELACENPVFAEKVEAVPVRVVASVEYELAYSRDYMIAYNAAAFLRLAVRQVGWRQLLLFMLDRAVNKPTRNPLKRMLAACAGGLLRRDLR